MKQKGKRKVGIFTLNGYSNYGNRLQLFALARVLNENGFEIEVFWPRSLGRIKKHLLYTIPMSRNRFEKERKLRKFTKQYIPKSGNCKKVQYSIIGSDQVWNPKWLPNFPYLLNIPNDSIKVSYAASVGTDTLTNEQEKLFKKYLQDYAVISVREMVAKGLLQPLTDKPIEVVLDPSLLLDVADYKELEKKPPNIDEGDKFILCYILGEKGSLDYAKRFAKKKGFRIIMFSDRDNSGYGVEEFLYLIHHAELVCTDSFHACVFSFLFDKPFMVFRRVGGADYMYSRIQNLLDTFRLNNCEFDGEELDDDCLEIDYSLGKKILAKERRNSLLFLRNATRINDEN